MVSWGSQAPHPSMNSPNRTLGAIVITLIALMGDQVIGSSLQRVANTSLKLPASPPQFGYTLQNAFPGLSLTQPLCLATPPGETNRLFILEKAGNIVVITNLANPTRTVFMRLSVVSSSEAGLLGIAFHPNYAENRYFYLFTSRNLSTSQGGGLHERISRFETSATNPNQGVPESELPLITQIDSADNHQGGDLHFGPDGYLYVSLGDEGPQFDGANNSQKINKNFFSAILRLDVDKRAGNLLPNPHPANTTNYFVPADNPYVGATSFNGQPVDPTKVRTEFYAVGFRNPWRMSFDSATSELYVGQVGQDAWEWVNAVVKGGNYGWAFFEGQHRGFKTPPAGFVQTPPIHEYAHGTGTNRGNSITGGLVYRGERLSQLYGAYIFADYVSGNVWMIHPDGTNLVPSQRLTGASGPAAFGTDPRNGDVLIAQLGGQIMRLNYNSTATGSALPPSLADTGAFSDLASLQVNPGIVPYDLNVPFWSDGAQKQRWFSLPDINTRMTFNRDGNWALPPGAVWIKHFELELTNGVPASRRRLETRFIVRNDHDVYGITYRWDDSQTGAALVPEEGQDEQFVIHDGGITRTQTWHYPSRAECLTCHTHVGGGVLGFNTPQMNRNFHYNGTVDNQIHALSEAGYFTENVTGIHTLRSLVAATNVAASLEFRVRSYLAANCANCHQPGGPTAAGFDARATTPTAQAGIIGGELSQIGGDTANRVIQPGSLEHSMMLQRIQKRGPGQMPPISTTVVDTNAVQLLTEWITHDATTFETFSQWQARNFVDAKSPEAASAADPDGDRLSNGLEFLVRTDPQLSSDAWAVSIGALEGAVQIQFPQIAGRGFEVQSTTNLFDAGSWRPLDVPANRPFFSATDSEATIEDPATAAAPTFYRVRVFEQ